MDSVRGFFRYIKRNVTLGIGLGILLFLILFTLIGFMRIDPKVDPYPLAAPASLPPTLSYCPAAEPDCEDPKAYPFGTDGQGRDLYAVAVTGTWMEMRIGLFAGIFGIIVGSIIAAVTTPIHVSRTSAYKDPRQEHSIYIQYRIAIPFIYNIE